MRVFFIFTFVLALFLILCLSSLYIIESYPLYEIMYRTFIVLEYSLLAYYFTLIILNKKLNTIILVSIAGFALFSIFDYLKSDKFYLSFYPQLIECIMFLFIIVYVFYEKMKNDLTTPIYQLPVFWISIAFLIYFSGNFFLFLYSKNSIQNQEFKFWYHLIYGTVTIMKNLLLCIGIYQTKYIITPVTSSDQFANLDLDLFNPTDKLKKV